MLTFKKNDAVKYIDPQSSLIDVLKADGWKTDEPITEPSERDVLKVRAAELGLEYPKNITTEKLAELVAGKAE